MHGLGISFGLDRLCMVLEELDLYPKTLQQAVDVVVLHFGDEFMQELMPHIIGWRAKGVRVFTYPTTHKLKNKCSLRISRMPHGHCFMEKKNRRKK